jgi:hypothetical protein
MSMLGIQRILEMNSSANYASFLPSRKFNPYRGLGNTCPVCSSSSGKCKAQAYELSSRNGKTVSTTKTLCMSETGGYGNPDYHYFGDTRDGTWGIYIPLTDWNEHRGENRQATPLEREEWVRQQQLKVQIALEAENQKRLESLPIAERDIAARAILAQLSLNDIDRKDLLRRGFTPQQIKDIGFKSIDPFQKLREPVNPRFPGVNINGDRLNNRSMGGILIPIYTVTGEIVGFQIRNRETSTKGRYRWLSSAWEQGRTNGNAPNLPNGELPLTFVYPQLLGAEMGARELSLAEGTGAKPNLAAVKLGHQVIGAAGGQFISSPEQLQEGLSTWNGDIVNLQLDGDDLKKPQVLRRWVNVYHQLIEWGYKPRLMWSGKDIDELDDITDLRELTLEELGQKSGLEIKLPITPAEPISMARKLYHKAQKFTPNETQHNRYLKWIIPEVIKNALIAIKSALGTGKTEILKELAAWAKERGYKLIFVGYRNNLLRQTCQRVPELYHVGDEDKIMLLGNDHLALCHHSAGKLDPADMKNTILVLDECVSDLRDMIGSKLTAGRNPDGTDSRQTRLAHIQQLMLSSYAVVALDAYLTDTEVEFLRELRNFDFTHKIENTYKNKMDVRMAKNKSTATREVIDLALANQGSILVTATTQKFCENLEKSLIRVGIPKEEIHRFDGTTDKNENNIEFFDNPSSYITRHKPRVLILSPTAESGISIDLTGYFITHYHFHLGNLGILSGLQFLGRYRDFSAPRVIYCEKQGMIDEGNSSGFSKWVKNSFDYQLQTHGILLETLLKADEIEDVKRFVNTQLQEHSSWIELAYKYKTIHNHEMQYLKELFIEKIREDGYTVTIDEDDLGCADTEELFEKVEMERQVIRSHQLYNAPNISKQEHEAIKKNLTTNESDRIAAAKYYLTQVLLPGIMETDTWSPEAVQMVKFTKSKIVKELENFFYLMNPKLAEINHVAAWMPVLQTGSAWMPDQLERSRLPLIKCGWTLGFHKLLEQDISIGDLDEILAKITGSKLYQSALKIRRIDPEKLPDSFKFVKRLLKRFGIVLKKSGQSFVATAMKDSIGKYQGAPKYDGLTPELIERLKGLSGQEFIGDNKTIQDLGKAMEAIGIGDLRGRMSLVAGAARYVGIKVFSGKRLCGKDKDGKDIIPRIYTFTDADSPISNAIRDTHVRPTNQPVNFAHIYECVEKRLKELAIRQQERIQEWQEAKAKGESPPIPIEDLADIVQIEYPDDLLGTSDLPNKRLTIEKGDRVTIEGQNQTGTVIDLRVHTWTTPKGTSGSANQCLVELEGGRQQWYDIDVPTIVD